MDEREPRLGFPRWKRALVAATTDGPTDQQLRWARSVRRMGDAVAVELVDVEPGDERLVGDLLPVLLELRPHLTAASFPATYERGYGQGLRYLAAYVGGACVGVAGWRLFHTTSAGRKLYVDDLVTSSAHRSAGVGRALLAELEARARAAGCTVLDLDSGTHRHDAHRFYHRESLTVRAFHFVKPL